MKKLIMRSVIVAAMAVAGSASADGAFKLGASQLDAISGAGYAKAGGVAGVAYTYHGVEVYSSAYAKGDRAGAKSSQIAACIGGHCGAVAVSNSYAKSRGKKRYSKKFW